MFKEIAAVKQDNFVLDIATSLLSLGLHAGIFEALKSQPDLCNLNALWTMNPKCYQVDCGHDEGFQNFVPNIYSDS